MARLQRGCAHVGQRVPLGGVDLFDAVVPGLLGGPGLGSLGGLGLESGCPVPKPGGLVLAQVVLLVGHTGGTWWVRCAFSGGQRAR